MFNEANQDPQEDSEIPYRRILQRRIRSFTSTIRRAPIIPLVIITILLVAALFGPIFAPYSPTKVSPKDSLKPPFWNSGGNFAHPFGTDRMGRDIFSRILYGARLSLGISLAVIAMGGVAGTILGLVSGYLGGRTDAVIQRGVEAVLSIPLILIALIIVYTLGPSITMVMFILAPFLAARFARMVRGDTLKVKEEQFILLARAVGASSTRIMWKHILPNVFNTIIVVATLEVGHLILVESSLSFLGVGVPPPHPAWGAMVASGRDQIMSAYWLSLIPGLVILATVLSLNLFGDWLRDTLDPRQRVL
ncbi:ABC transporter permease [Thermodesulfobacteriota bacterium]